MITPTTPTIIRTITVGPWEPVEPPPMEERITSRIMVLIPIIGSSIEQLIEDSIQTKIGKARDLDTMIRLIQLKNQCKALSIIRMAFITALLFYFGGEEWGPTFGIALFLGFLPSVSIHCRNLAQNLQTLVAIKTNDIDSLHPVR